MLICKYYPLSLLLLLLVFFFPPSSPQISATKHSVLTVVAPFVTTAHRPDPLIATSRLTDTDPTFTQDDTEIIHFILRFYPLVGPSCFELTGLLTSLFFQIDAHQAMLDPYRTLEERMEDKRIRMDNLSK